MLRLAILVLALSFSAAVHCGEPASGLMTQNKACDLLKKRVGKFYSLAESETVRAGWFCDFTTYEDTSWFVIGLRSNRQCEGICSNLVGWYAVDRRTGSVRDFDVGPYQIGAELPR
jgi:hypothetical protein